jgi:hypothetical protein
MKLYGSWSDTLVDLSKKSEEISKGNVNPDAYKEFYSMWTNVYQQTYGKFLNVQNPKESEEQLKAVFENFAKSTTICTNLCKSWITTLDKLSEKSKEFSLQTNAQDTQKEVCNLWVRIYQKAFDSIFDNMPVASSFKDTLAPVKDAAKLYVETLTKMSDNLIQSEGRANRV